MCEIRGRMTNSPHSNHVPTTTMKKQKGCIEQQRAKTERRSTMQLFLRMCCVFESDVGHAQLWGSSALGRLVFNMSLISINTKESVYEEMSV